MNILVTGSSGFIGSNLIRKLMNEGHVVIGVDIVKPVHFSPNLFYLLDLRDQKKTIDFFRTSPEFDEVYNLACLMGGMGYIGDRAHDYDIMIGSSQIVMNVAEAATLYKTKKIFYSSSACVYNMNFQNDADSASLKESNAYPAMPDLVYGWQKLFSEQIMQATKLNYRIARFHNIYGPLGVFSGGKEKAPAALCRKVAMAKAGGEIEVWGDGQQTRSFLYIDECLEGIERLMNSEWPGAINIGSSESISINDLAQMIIDISGKKLTIKNIPGPEGVRGRNSDNEHIYTVLKWQPSQPLREGIEKTYSWINKQINGNV
jgi:GDP-D-mannose 3',5'-epimerase